MRRNKDWIRSIIRKDNDWEIFISGKIHQSTESGTQAKEKDKYKELYP